jgi:hypothetical protein
MGTCAILNVAGGDIEVTFANKNPSETIRAARVLRDMLRRGYAILVEVERDGVKAFERALDFDEKNCRYIIADFNPLVAEEADMHEGAERMRARDKAHQEEGDGQSEQVETEATPPSGGKAPGKRGRPRKSVDATTTRAVAVGRSAGG